MLLECKKLTKKYDTVIAVDEVNLKIGRGKIIGLLGSNGSGKTTLIKLINDLLVPTSGEVLINKEKPGIESKKIISYLPEKNFLDNNMRIYELVAYFDDFYDNFNKEKAYKLLKDLDIDQKVLLKNLSKGTKEKVALALVMSREADLYVLDEPIGGVDPAARDHILDTILSNFNENATVILSTHLIADIETILDEVIFISKGKIVLHENADKLRKKRGKSVDAIFREDFKC